MLEHLITGSGTAVLSHPRPGDVSTGMNGWFSHASQGLLPRAEAAQRGNLTSSSSCPWGEVTACRAHKVPGEWADGGHTWRLELMVTEHLL